jgi:hypothetical protein
MSRKRRSKRHIKRYNKHVKTRIRRNMYRKKHKKTQRGGVRFSNILPSDYKFSTQAPYLKRGSTSSVIFFDNNDIKIDIAASDDTNTLNGKRYLEGKLKAYDGHGFNDDVDTKYFFITNVKQNRDSSERIDVDIRRILRRHSGTVVLSQDRSIILTKPLETVTDTNTTDYKVYRGFFPKNVNDIPRIIVSMSGVDLDNIPENYTDPDEHLPTNL